MSLNTLEEIANYIVSDGKGILAADESNPTCGKRFDSIGVESTEINRRDYREMLFRASGMQDNIGGVILFDETIRQSAEDGTSLVELIKNQGALPGIKVDKGLAPLESSPEETVTQGLDGLDERCKDYVSLGAKFTKWRAVIKISDSLPTDECIEANMQALAKYAKIVQSNNMVPMVEPEVLMDGSHTIDQCYEATSKSLRSLFQFLN
jgi:fructose-bisphosphate aldolase class I